MALEEFKSSNNPSDKRALLVRTATDTLKIYGIDYSITVKDRDDFISGKKNDFGDISLCFMLGRNINKACRVVNKAIKNFGGEFEQGNHGMAFLYLNRNDDDLELPEDESQDIHFILDNTDPSRVFLSSDWHIFGDHYGKGKNHVNIRDIVSWCKKNIKDDDVFIFLGDLTHRYCNEEDQQKASAIYRSIPGIKVLILGNHDIITGEDFYNNCGFDFIFNELIHNGVIYTHRPKNIDIEPECYLNIHGHKHNVRTYNVTDGKSSINVYPEFFDNKPTTLKYCLAHVGKLTKDNIQDYGSNYKESTISETKRSELPSSSFGIPEDRKFPLDTKQHINSAIKLFGHAEESKKKLLAKRISSAAKKYNISIKDDSQVAKYLSEASDVVYQKDSIMVNNDGELIEMDIKNICHWYVTASRYPGDIPEENYSKNLIDAIESCEDITEENNQLYVFICNGLRRDLDHCFKGICVGIITVDENKQYEWLIQYPIDLVDGEYKGLSINEWAMSSVNPIVGVSKPFIMKIGTMDSTLNPKQYLFSPDVVSDKYLAISEDAKLTIVDAKSVANYYIESEYEFVGDRRKLSKIYEAYKSGKIVDNTFFYTALAGKPLLTEDQIDFDKDFRKINFKALKESFIGKLATTESQYNSISRISNNVIDIGLSESIYGTLDTKYGIKAKFSLDGYYLESSVLNTRSPYYDTLEELKESDSSWLRLDFQEVI